MTGIVGGAVSIDCTLRMTCSARRSQEHLISHLIHLISQNQEGRSPGPPKEFGSLHRIRVQPKWGCQFVRAQQHRQHVVLDTLVTVFFCRVPFGDHVFWGREQLHIGNPGFHPEHQKGGGRRSCHPRPAPGRRGWPLLLAPLLVLQGCDMVGQIESTVEAGRLPHGATLDCRGLRERSSARFRDVR